MRYFFISYHTCSEGSFGFGNRGIASEVYPNRFETAKSIEADLQPGSKAIILNIQELTEEDYKSLFAESKA